MCDSIQEGLAERGAEKEAAAAAKKEGEAVAARRKKAPDKEK